MAEVLLANLDDIPEGIVIGPAAAAEDQIAAFGATPTVLKDAGYTILEILDRVNHTGAQAISTVTDLQATLDAKQALDAELTALAGLTSAADKVPYFTGSAAAALADLTSVARTLIAQTTQALMRTAGLGLSANGSSLVSAADYAAMQVLLGLVIGTNVQAQDAELAALAGLTSAADKVPYFTGSGTAALADFSTTLRTFLSSPSSANLAALVTGETGSGALVFGTTPTLATPVVSGNPTGTVTSGTYTPTASALVNLATCTPLVFQYMRVGNVVTVSGQVTVDATAGGAAAACELTLPIASNFASGVEAAGSGAVFGGAGLPYDAVRIMGSSANDTILVQYFAQNAASTTMSVQFTYLVL